MNAVLAITTLFLSLMSFTSQAQASDALTAREQLIGTVKLEQELIADLDLRLKLNSIILEVASQIDQEHPGLSPWQDSAKLEKIFKSKAAAFEKLYLDRIESLGPEKISLFKKIWRSIAWSNLVDVFKRSTLGIQVMFKRQGIGIAIAVFMGFVSDYTIPFILTNVGAPWLIPISAVIPYQILYSMLPQKTTELKIRHKIRSSLGGQANYQAFMRQEMATREALKSMREDSILLSVNFNQEVPDEILSVRKNSWFRSFIQQMGFNERDFSYATLRRFLRDNNIEDDYIKRMIEHPRLERWQKAALIASHLQETMGEEQRLAFRTRFDNSFLQIKASLPWDGFEQWTKDVLRAKSVREINHLFFQIPEDTPTRLILEVWQDVILPHYATQTNLNYFRYRSLIENFAATKAQILTTEAPTWSISTHQQLLRYLGRSMRNDSFTNCKNSGQQVLQFLLSR